MENTENKTYELRRLVDRDLFPVLDILGKIMPDELANIFVQIATKEKRVEEVGMTVMMRLIKEICKHIGTVHDELYAFLSDVSGIPAKEIEEMPFGTTPLMLVGIVKNEKNADFFKVLSELF